jgi:uncharacterized protein (DUF934 family)
MSVLTIDGRWVDDDWTIADDESAATQPGAVLPLAAWQAVRGEAVWLGPTDEPALIADSVSRLTRVAIRFPKFTDGRGYSIAVLLRSRHGYAGDLRAIGDVLVDQLWYLGRAGFSSFALRPDQDRTTAERALRTFSDSYQGSVSPVLPAFRRHLRPAAEAR